MAHNDTEFTACAPITQFRFAGAKSRNGHTKKARRGYYERRFKRVFDVFLVLLALPFLATVFAVLYVIVRRDGGYFLYRHTRVGRNGVEFPCFKVRTMAVDADSKLRRTLRNNPELAEEWRKTFKLRNDPRITPIGHMLRKTGLDELPQLFNVLRGDMSLVGPRPITVEELKRYNNEGIEAYVNVRPGLTGLWQVTARRQNDFENRDKIDSKYVRELSFLGDCEIILRTIPEVLGARGC